MKFDAVVQKTDLIDEHFYVLCDNFSELHWGDNLEDLKSKILAYYDQDLPIDKETGVVITPEAFAEYVNSLEEKSLEKIDIKIKKPNYSETSSMLVSSTSINTDGLPKIDYVEYNKQRILRLLKEWNLERDGKVVPVSLISVGSLHPNVIDGILSKINKNIPHYLGTIIA